MANLFIRNGDDWKLVQSGHYRSLVLIGQRDAGRGNFFIDTGDIPPSRNEQLLLPDSTKTSSASSSKLQSILASI